MFGQSAALFGYNPYKNGDMTNTGLEFGLDTIKSDYVGRIALQPYRDFALFTDARFSDSDWAMRQVEAGASWNRWSVQGRPYLRTLWGPARTWFGYAHGSQWKDFNQDRGQLDC